MSNVRTLSSLSPHWRRLIALMQAINFGRIENLHIRNSEPVFDPAPRIVREVKFGSENGPRRELDCADFVLKTQVVELFEELHRIQNGVVECLSIKHGLPFSMHAEAAA